jgi:DNA-binding protein HU-beta
MFSHEAQNPLASLRQKILIASANHFPFVPNHIFDSEAHSALLGGIIMALPVAAKKPAAAAKTKRPVTLKHLAAVLAEEHQLTKRVGEALLGDLVSLITKHLKKGELVRIAGLGILQVRKRAAVVMSGASQGRRRRV